MLEIERVGWLKPRYVVRDDRGHHGSWTRRRFSEAVSGELDGERCELRREGRTRFLLMRSGSVLATAEAGKRGRWRISLGASTYELRRKTAWRSEMELLRSGGPSIGSIRKGKGLRGRVVCDLPTELSPAAQTLIGFLVLTLWNRDTASTGAETVAVSASG